MKLRDYINNNELEQSNNIDNDSYILAKKIILLVKNRDYNQAMLALDKNLDDLYKDLNLPSFCFLIDYYINNMQEQYLDILQKRTILSLLISLSNDYDEKNKMYFINKLDEYYLNRQWEDALSCIEILLDKTDADKFEMESIKLDLLINLKRYEESLIKCEELLKINSEDKSLNSTKIEILIQLKEYKKLEQYVALKIQSLNKKNLLRAYLVLGKYYESEKNYVKSYDFYKKVNAMDSGYKIPIKIINKVKKNKNNIYRIKELFIIILILSLMSISVYKLMDKYKIDNMQSANVKTEEIKANND